MPFHADMPYYVHRMKEANRLFSFAMRRSPGEYYNFINTPSLDTLAEEAGTITAAEFSHVFETESEAVDLFKAGIQDIIPPFTTIAQQLPELTQPQANTIMVHERTIALYGLLASMPQDELAKVYQHGEKYFELSAARDSITLIQPVASSEKFGCEAITIHAERIEMLPLFKKFVPWAGSLAVRAYYEKRP